MMNRINQTTTRSTMANHRISAFLNIFRPSRYNGAMCCLLLASTLPAVEVAGVDYSQDDKRAHAILGVAAASSSMLLLDRLDPDAPWYVRAAVGIGSAAIVGAVKEAADSRNPERHDADWRDWAATTTGGAVVAVTLSWRF